MDGWAWKEGRKEGWIDGWMDGWKDGRMDGWMDGRMDGWMVCECVIGLFINLSIYLITAHTRTYVTD